MEYVMGNIFKVWLKYIDNLCVIGCGEKDYSGSSLVF